MKFIIFLLLLLISACSSDNPVSSDDSNINIVLNGNATDTIKLMEHYNDLGAIATTKDGDTLEVVKTSNLDSSKVGSYTITYTAKDSLNNSASISRNVVVVDTKVEVDLSTKTVLSDTKVIYQITSNAYLSKDVVIDSNVMVYILNDANLTLSNCNLTIRKGATIFFSENSYIDIDQGASISIEGTKNEPVIMTSAETGKYWGYTNGPKQEGGIYIEDGTATTNNINYLNLKLAKTGICVDAKKAITIKNSKIDSCENYGIHYRTNDVCANGLDSNSFMGNGVADIYTNGNNIIYFTKNNNFETGVLIKNNYSGDIIESGNWTALKYIVEATITIGDNSLTKPAIITINPGAEFYFKENGYIDVIKNGVLNIEGTATNRVTMYSHDTGKFWGYSNGTDMQGGVYVENSNETIEYVDFSDAKTAVCSENSSVIINNCTFTNSENQDLLLKADGTATVDGVEKTIPTNESTASYSL